MKLFLQDAVGYVEYNIENKDIFHFIDTNLSGVWELLLWNDSANFGDVKGSLTVKNLKKETLTRMMKRMHHTFRISYDIFLEVRTFTDLPLNSKTIECSSL